MVIFIIIIFMSHIFIIGDGLASRCISKWIHVLLVVIISVFEAFDSIGILSLLIRANEMEILAYLFYSMKHQHFNSLKSGHGYSKEMVWLVWARK